MKSRFSILQILIAMTITNVPVPGLAQALRVGTAKADITPNSHGFPTMWLGGFAGRGSSPATGAATPLYARALAIKDGASTKVIVSADLLGIPRGLHQQIAADVFAAYGVALGSLLIAASHDHSGPVLTDNLDPYVTYGLTSAQLAIVNQYTAWLRTRISTLIGAAIGGLSNSPPITMSFGVGTAGFAANRIDARGIGHVGTIDNDVPVLVFKANGQVLAVVFSYSCHPVFLDALSYHYEFPGVAAARLEQDYPGATALFVAGAGGDLNPKDGYTVESAGNSLAAAVETVLVASVQPLSASVYAQYQELNLPLNRKDANGNLVTNSRFRAVYASLHVDDQQACDRHAGQMVQQVDAGTLPSALSLPVAVWKFGCDPQVALVAIGGEPVSGYAVKFKNQFASQFGARLWVAGYANEVPCYIPTQAVLDIPTLGTCNDCGGCFGPYEAGWGNAAPYFEPGTGIDVTPAIADGSILFYGWPSPLKGNHDGLPGVEELVGAVVTDLVGGTTTVIYVDQAYGGTIQDGTRAHPFRTVAGGYGAAPQGALLSIAGGVYYEAPITLSKNIRLERLCSPVTIR